MKLNTSTLRVWQKGGLFGAGAFLLLAASLWMQTRAGWWYADTIWFRALLFVHYPAPELERVFLNKLHIPRLYDVPLAWHEVAVIDLTGASRRSDLVVPAGCGRGD